MPDWQLLKVVALVGSLGDIPMAPEEHTALVEVAGLPGDTAVHLANVIRRARHGAPNPTPAAPLPTWEAQVTAALRTVFDWQVVASITTDEAFGALLHRLQQECQTTGESPTDALRAMPDDEREFCAIAYHPAGFLASRIERGQR